MQVKLKDLVGYVADVIAHNAVTWAVGQVVGPRLDVSAAQLSEKADSLAAGLVPAGAPAAPSMAAPTLAPSTDQWVHQWQLEKLAGDLIARATVEAQQQGRQMAERQLQENAVRAMVALAPAELGEAVIGTAAAIAAEAAAAQCLERLDQQVQNAVWQGVNRQVTAALARVARASRAPLP